MRNISRAVRPQTILHPLFDAANALTLLGAATATAGLLAAVMGRPAWAISLALIAVAIDWIDGVVAARSARRPRAGTHNQ